MTWRVAKNRLKTPEERDALFWAQVDRSGGLDACHPWTGAMSDDDYGLFAAGGNTRKRAHRVAWEKAHGPIPPGKKVLHTCDNRPCCNERHLFLGTHADNAADMVAKGRQARGPRVGPVPERRARGDRNGRSILTEAQAQAILDSDESGVALAARYGISVRTVYQIWQRINWRHLTKGRA